MIRYSPERGAGGGGRAARTVWSGPPFSSSITSGMFVVRLKPRQRAFTLSTSQSGGWPAVVLVLQAGQREGEEGAMTRRQEVGFSCARDVMKTVSSFALDDLLTYLVAKVQVRSGPKTWSHRYGLGSSKEAASWSEGGVALDGRARACEWGRSPQHSTCPCPGSSSN